jgi:L-amino acid N-acyltransferase YncA
MATDIRLVAPTDAKAIADIYRPFVESSPISFETDPPDETEIQKRISGSLPSYPWLICELEGCVAGYAYASRHRARSAYKWSVDVSVYVRPEFQRRGIGRGLYLSLVRILRAQGFFNAYAGIALPNPGSAGLHESIGFKAVGVYHNVGYKQGAWHDVGWWELALQPLPADPSSPLSVGRVQADPSWAAILTAGLAAIRPTE